MIILYGEVGDLDGEVRLEGKGFLTEERYERLQTYRMEADKKRCFGAGLLLYYGLNLSGLRFEPAKLHRTIDGKPYIEGTPKIHFNLSHAGKFAAAVFDIEEVGIDIEESRRYNPKVARRFFTQAEQRYLLEAKDEREQRERFGFIWTRKESYIKAVGLGMRQDLTAFEVLGTTEDGFGFETFSVGEDCQLSVCSRRGVGKCRPEKIDLLKIVKGD